MSTAIATTPTVSEAAPIVTAQASVAVSQSTKGIFTIDVKIPTPDASEDGALRALAIVRRVVAEFCATFPNPNGADPFGKSEA